MTADNKNISPLHGKKVSSALGVQNCWVLIRNIPVNNLQLQGFWPPAAEISLLNVSSLREMKKSFVMRCKQRRQLVRAPLNCSFCSLESDLELPNSEV